MDKRREAFAQWFDAKLTMWDVVPKVQEVQEVFAQPEIDAIQQDLDIAHVMIVQKDARIAQLEAAVAADDKWRKECEAQPPRAWIEHGENGDRLVEATTRFVPQTRLYTHPAPVKEDWQSVPVEPYIQRNIKPAAYINFTTVDAAIGFFGGVPDGYEGVYQAGYVDELLAEIERLNVQVAMKGEK